MGGEAEILAVEIPSDRKPYWTRFGSIVGALVFLAIFPFFFERDAQTEGFQILAFGMGLAVFALACYVRPRTLELRLEGEQVVLVRGTVASEVSLPVTKVHRIHFTPLGHVLGQSLDYLEMGEQNAKRLPGGPAWFPIRNGGSGSRKSSIAFSTQSGRCGEEVTRPTRREGPDQIPSMIPLRAGLARIAGSALASSGW